MAIDRADICLARHRIKAGVGWCDDQSLSARRSEGAHGGDHAGVDAVGDGNRFGVNIELVAVSVPFHDFGNQAIAIGQIAPVMMLNSLFECLGYARRAFEVLRRDPHAVFEHAVGIAACCAVPASTAGPDPIVRRIEIKFHSRVCHRSGRALRLTFAK